MKNIAIKLVKIDESGNITGKIKGLDVVKAAELAKKLINGSEYTRAIHKPEEDRNNPPNVLFWARFKKKTLGTAFRSRQFEIDEGGESVKITETYSKEQRQLITEALNAMVNEEKLGEVNLRVRVDIGERLMLENRKLVPGGANLYYIGYYSEKTEGKSAAGYIVLSPNAESNVEAAAIAMMSKKTSPEHSIYAALT